MLKDQGINETGTVRTDRLGKELKLKKNSISTELRGTIKCHYEQNAIGVICRNDNGPIIMISNVHAYLPHIKIDRPHCN